MLQGIYTTILWLIAAHVATLLTLAPTAQGLRWPDLPMVVVLALVACQVGVLAVWAALSDEAWFVRYPLLAFAAAALSMYLPIAAGGRGQQFVSQWALLLGIESLFVLAPLQLVRSIGVRMVAPRPPRQAPRGARQFSVRYLILWTAAVALLLGLARIGGWQPRWDSWSWIALGDFRRGSTLGIGFAAAALLGTWAALSDQSPAARLTALLLLGPGIGLVLARLLAEFRTHGAAGYAASALLCALAAGLETGTLLVVRHYCGFRLKYAGPRGEV